MDIITKGMTEEEYDYHYNEELKEAVIGLNKLGILYGFTQDKNGLPLTVRPKEALTNERYYLMMWRMLKNITTKVVI